MSNRPKAPVPEVMTAMTPNQALNIVMGGHGAMCENGLAPCKKCEREYEAEQVLRKLIAEHHGAEAGRGGEGWVSVEERLPGHSEYVLVCAQLGPDRRVVAEGQWFGALWSLHHFGQVPSAKVTLWREKPAPPESR